MRPAVFLDRDNTLIANDGDLGDPHGVTLLAGVRDGLRDLASAGFALVVVSNQGGVARGRYGELDVDRVHERIQELVGEDAVLVFYFCPFHPEGSVPEYTREHPWRKPSPGMILAAAEEHGFDLARSWMVGDQQRDIDAGQAAGCKTIFIGDEQNGTDAMYDATDFREAADTILAAKETP
jgi:D,D-heptose 1,7-bisphosphate phosphatase